jgi:anti-anti-sigma factor
MSQAPGILDYERDKDILIILPRANLAESDYEQIEEGAKDVLALLNNGQVKNVVMDFTHTNYYGSTALGFFLKLWKRVKSQNGKMAFCNVSEHEREILQLTHLDTLWPICKNRSEALAAVK